MKMIRTAFLAAAVFCPLVSWANTCVPIQAGATDQTVYLELIHSTTGVPTAGLAFNATGIDLEYVRSGAAATDITEATQTAGGAHSDGGFISVGHGRYRLDLPDAAVAAGVTQVVVQGVIDDTTDYIVLPCVVALSPPVNVVAAAGTAWGSGAITAASIATDAIGSAEVADGAIDAGALATDTITAAKIAADAIAASEIATDAIGAAELAAGAIAASEIATDAIDADAIAADAVGASELAANAIAAAEIADGAIDEATFATTAGSFRPLGILDQGTAQAYTAGTPSLTLRAAAAFGVDALAGSVAMICGSTQGYCQSTTIVSNDASDVATLAAALEIEATGTLTYYIFGTPQAGSSLGEVSLAAGAITSSTFAAGAIDASAIAADAIGASEIAADAIGASELATDAIGAAELAAGAIAAAEIATDAIDADAIAANALTTAEIATGAISSDEVADNAIDAGALASDAITAAKIATDAIGAAEIAADAIGASELATDAIGAAEIATNAIDAAATAADFSSEVQDANIVELDGTAISCTAGESCGP